MASATQLQNWPIIYLSTMFPNGYVGYATTLCATQTVKKITQELIMIAHRAAGGEILILTHKCVSHWSWNFCFQNFSSLFVMNTWCLPSIHSSSCYMLHYCFAKWFGLKGSRTLSHPHPLIYKIMFTHTHTHTPLFTKSSCQNGN